MTEQQESLQTIHLFNRQSGGARVFLFVLGGLLFAGGATGAVWTAEELYDGTLTPRVGLVGVGSLIALYFGFGAMNQSRFKYIPTTASS